MKSVKVAVAVLALSASFLVGGALATRVLAQTPPRDPTSMTTPPDKQVLSGENIGIRVIGSPDQNHLVQGSLVAKINGQWVDVVLSPKTIGSAK
jgi:hypothetical protein